MALGQNRHKIAVRGGDVRVRELWPTPSDTWVKLGHTKELVFFNEPGIVESMNDLGDLANVQNGSEHARFEFNLLQSGKDELDLLTTAAEKVYEVWLGGYTVAGVAQAVLFPCAKIESGFQAPFQAATERAIPVKVHGLAPSAALTRTPTDYNTANRQAFVVAEHTTNAAAPPTDGAAIPAAAV